MQMRFLSTIIRNRTVSCIIVTLKKILKNTIKVYRRVVFLRTLLYFFENTPDVPNCIAVVQQIHELFSENTIIVSENTKNV